MYLDIWTGFLNRFGSIRRIESVKLLRMYGVRVGNWLSLRQAQTLLNTPDIRTKKGLRDWAMFATLLGCGKGTRSDPRRR